MTANDIPPAEETRARVDREQAEIAAHLLLFFAGALRSTRTGRVSTTVSCATVDTVGRVGDAIRAMGYKVETLPAKDDGWLIEVSLPREDGK